MVYSKEKYKSPVHTESDENGLAIQKSSKSVGSLFNQFNAFWALSYILINILALFFYMTTTNGFYKGVCFGLFISKNEF